MSEVKNRLKQFISSKNLSVRKFEDSINASFSYVNNISRSIGIDKIQLIDEKYPELNLTWLLTGKGTMLNSTTGLDFENFIAFAIKNNEELLNNEDYRLILKKNIAILELEEERKKLDEEMRLLKQDMKQSTKK